MKDYDLELANHFQAIAELYRERSGVEFQSPTVRGQEGSDARKSSTQFPPEPEAKSMYDLVTPKQLGMIRALGREASVDVEAECQKVMKCKTESLSKRAASSLIDHLKELQIFKGEDEALSKM